MLVNPGLSPARGVAVAKSLEAARDGRWEGRYSDTDRVPCCGLDTNASCVRAMYIRYMLGRTNARTFIDMYLYQKNNQEFLRYGGRVISRTEDPPLSS